jgi:hypothetical protein
MAIAIPIPQVATIISKVSDDCLGRVVDNDLAAQDKPIAMHLLGNQSRLRKSGNYSPRVG